MPIHDWSRVGAGVFFDFHMSWVVALKRVLNDRLLPANGYYAIVERPEGDVRPDFVVHPTGAADDGRLRPPRAAPTAVADDAFTRRHVDVISIREADGHGLVAQINVIVRGAKSSPYAFRSFLDGVGRLIERGVHLLVIDLHPPGACDPLGLHAAIWAAMTEVPPGPPGAKPLTLASYECGSPLRAYVDPVAVGDELAEMPLFLMRNRCVEVPLEATYRAAFAEVPWRWKDVLDAPG